MSKKPSPGGTVQIGGKLYVVLEGPKRHGAWYRLMVRSQEHQGAYWAQSESWRSGYGPWKLAAPVIDD